MYERDKNKMPPMGGGRQYNNKFTKKTRLISNFLSQNDLKIKGSCSVFVLQFSIEFATHRDSGVESIVR